MKVKYIFTPALAGFLKPKRLLFSLLAVSLLAFPMKSRGDYTAVVNPNSVVVNHFLGWGTSLCWWANVVGSYSNREEYMDLAFSRLKLNIVRYNIGGGENSTNNFLGYRARMPGFEPTNGVWNWNADANQRWVLQAALARGANLVDAFANSPPWWMTVSGSVTGAVGATNNLQVADETLFATYLATVVSNLTVLDGVHFDYVTPMNEPNGSKWTYGGSQEGCDMSPAQQARVVNALRTALNTSLPSAGIDAAEDVNPNQSYNDLNSYSAAAISNLALCTTHTYSTTGASSLVAKVNAIGKPLWVSEYGDNDGTGITMARRIRDDIIGMGVQAWCYWQVVDSASGWGFLLNPLNTNSSGGFTTAYTFNKKFYAMGQFSEFIRPGCQIINVNDTNTLAAYNRARGTLVLVTVNTNTSSFNVTYNLSAFNSAPAQVAVYQTSASANLVTLPPLPITNQQFTSAIPAKSVTTFVVSYPAPLQTDAYALNLLSYGPAAYWRLTEPVSNTTAYDYVGGRNGSYGSATTNGQPGIPNPPFLGVSTNDLGVWMNHAGGANGFVTTSAMNVTVSNATLLCWIYPKGSQSNSEGLVFSRGTSSAVNGINYGANNRFAYTWANNSATYTWSSGLTIPTNMWSFLALVITPSNAVGYVFNSNGQGSAVNAVANPVETLASGFTLGADPQTSTLSTRIFNGEMDDVAVFNYALMSAQLNQIYSMARTGLTVTIQESGSSRILTWPFGALYQSSKVNGPWTPVLGAVSPYTNTPAASQMFYHVVAAL